MARTARINREPELLTADEARPCPWCGAAASIQYWHGGRPTKRLVSCSSQGDTLMRGGRPVECQVSPSVTGETRAEALRRWNDRKAPGATVTEKMIQAACVAGYGVDIDNGSNLHKLMTRALNAAFTEADDARSR